MSRRWPFRERRLKTLVIALALMAGCAPAKRSLEPSPSPAIRSPGRIAVIVMENHEYGQIMGNHDAPFLNELARRNALATNYYARTHPSLPNYLELLSGDTFGVSSDCTECYVNGKNLVDSLGRGHISWKAYMEGMPRRCFSGAFAGRYAKKHNPFMYFDNIREDAARCANVVPLTELDDSHLPDFTWITPDECNDMHDCSVAVGDNFLAHIVPGLLQGLGPHGVLFITFDEGTTNKGGGGHIVTIAAGPGAKPGRFAPEVDHTSLLQTIEKHFGVPYTGRAATAPSLDVLR